MKTNLPALISNVSKVIATPVLLSSRTGKYTCYKVTAIMSDGTELILRKALTERPAEIFFFDCYQYNRYDFNDLSNACSTTPSYNSVRRLKVESDIAEIVSTVKDLISKHADNFELIVNLLKNKYETYEDRAESHNVLMTLFPFKDETVFQEEQSKIESYVQDLIDAKIPVGNIIKMLQNKFEKTSEYEVAISFLKNNEKKVAEPHLIDSNKDHEESPETEKGTELAPQEIVNMAYDANTMKTYFITRHPGAVDWIKSKNIHVDVFLKHVDESFFDSLVYGDLVIGVLPVALVEKVCLKGALYFDLSLPNLPLELRGKELTAQQMTECGATLTHFHVYQP